MRTATGRPADAALPGSLRRGFASMVRRMRESRFRDRLIAMLLLFGSMLPYDAGATTVRRMDWSQLAHEATVSGVGEVIGLETRRFGRRIATLATVSLTLPLRGGATADRLTVLIPGGVVGEWAQQVTGAPSLRIGDRRLFFLSPGPGGRWLLVGLAQGAALVRPDGSMEGGWAVEGPAFETPGMSPAGERNALLPLLRTLREELR